MPLIPEEQRKESPRRRWLLGAVFSAIVLPGPAHYLLPIVDPVGVDPHPLQLGSISVAGVWQEPQSVFLGCCWTRAQAVALAASPGFTSETTVVNGTVRSHDYTLRVGKLSWAIIRE